MDRERPALSPHDPELDPPPTRRPRRPLPSALLVPQEYQRLVANPFLAVALGVAWFWGLRLAVSSQTPVALAFIAMAAALALVIRCLHYHCLDCGGTGWLFRWRKHACEAVVARQLADRVRRWRGPTPTVQAVLWIYLLVMLTIAAVVSRMVPIF